MTISGMWNLCRIALCATSYSVSLLIAFSFTAVLAQDMPSASILEPNNDGLEPLPPPLDDPDFAPLDPGREPAEATLPRFEPEPSRPVVPAATVTPAAYVLGSGDQIRVDVFRIEAYSGDYEVAIDGSLNLPMVGKVFIQGLTLEQAQGAIAQAYSTRLRRPIINIRLLSPRPLQISVAGEVSRPGGYTLGREGTQFPSLVNALQVAGGVTQSADVRQVLIQRRAGVSEPANEPPVIVADLWQFLTTGDARNNVTLRDGDTIFVPTRTTYDPEESRQLAVASFAADESQPLNIAVIGEVFRPGPYTVTGTARTGDAGLPGGSSGGGGIPPTVTRAIQVAGGIKPQANIREIQIYRRTRSGQQQTIAINLWDLLAEGDITEDVVLQEGDSVFIPQAAELLPGELAEVAAASFSPDTIRINVVGEVDRAGTVEIPPNTPLSQGILAAGGFDNRRARTVDVELVRLNLNGSVTRRTIAVDFAAGIDDEANPLLQNNDVIIVQRSLSATVADTVNTITTPLGGILSLFNIPRAILNLFD